VGHTIPNLAIVCDPGPDPDDVKVLLIAAHLHAQGMIRVRGIVCNGGGKGEPMKRAALAAAVWAHTGAEPVPVGVGSEGKGHSASAHEYRLDGFDSAMSQACLFEDGVGLLKRVLYEVEAEGGTLLLQVQAGMRDVADLMQQEPERVIKVVRKCSIMGGLERNNNCGPCVTHCGPSDTHAGATMSSKDWSPDMSQNNQFDAAAAAYVYDFCLSRGVSMNVVSRIAVPPLRMSLAKGFADRNPDDVMMRYLCAAQVEGLVGLWGRVHASAEAREAARRAGMDEHEAPTGTLPARCNKKWFYQTFCGVTASEYDKYQTELDQETEATIGQRLEGTVRPYDVVALMTLLPGAEKTFRFGNVRTKVRTEDGSGQVVDHFLFLHEADAPAVDSVEGLLCGSFETHSAVASMRADKPESQQQRQAHASDAVQVTAMP